jgi:hypothetical protein
MCRGSSVLRPFWQGCLRLPLCATSLPTSAPTTTSARSAARRSRLPVAASISRIVQRRSVRRRHTNSAYGASGTPARGGSGQIYCDYNSFRPVARGCHLEYRGAALTISPIQRCATRLGHDLGPKGRAGEKSKTLFGQDNVQTTARCGKMRRTKGVSARNLPMTSPQNRPTMRPTFPGPALPGLQK